MLLVKYLLLLTGWGLLVAAAANVFRNLYQVVQYHRQLRPIAPGSLSGMSSTSSGPEGTPAALLNSAATHTHSSRLAFAGELMCKRQMRF